MNYIASCERSKYSLSASSHLFGGRQPRLFIRYCTQVLKSELPLKLTGFLHCVLAHNTLTGDKGVNMSSPPISEIESLNVQHQVTSENNNSKLRQNEDLSHGENYLSRQVPNRKTSYKTLRIFTKFAYYFRPDWTKSTLCYIILK